MESVKRPYRWARGRADRALKIDFVRFCIVGATGFILTAIGLRFFHGSLEIPVTLATLMSAEIGLLSNFFFHQRWTYKYADHNHKPIWLKFVHFHLTSWTGVVLITILESIGVHLLGLDYMVSLVGAAGITLFWNFFWTKYFIFKGGEQSPLLQSKDKDSKEPN